MKTSRVVDFLDCELNVAAFEDYSHNGLQVQNSGNVRKVCCGVDASMAFFEEAAGRGADFLVCHHGISWGDSLKRITELNYTRVKFLLDHDMALYACHLPLDAHPRHGNNALICKALGLKRLKPFGRYEGNDIGFVGSLPSPIRYTTLLARIRRVMGNEPQTMDFGKRTVRTVAVVSGGAAEGVVEAGQKGIDVYLSGEPKLSAYSCAQEYRINAVFGGHYATEVFGVRAIGELVKRRFKLPAEFVRFEIGY